MVFPSKSSDGMMRTGTRCILNATSAVCFGSLLLLILGPALLSPESIRILGGGSRTGLAVLAKGLLVPLAEAGVLSAVIGGTLASERRRRNLAAAVAGLLAALAILRHLQVV
jgi:hypothetical protein